MKIGRRNIVVGIICLILILGLAAIARASEAAPQEMREPAQEVGQESHGVALGGETAETGQKDVAEEAHEVTGEKKAEGHEVAPEGEGHEVSEGGEKGHEAAPEGEEAGEEHGGEGEHENPIREYGAPAAYFFIGAFILLLIFVMTRYKYDNMSDLSRKIPGLIAVTIYIFSIMVIAHYVAGAWSLILVPVFLFALLKFWPHI